MSSNASVMVRSKYIGAGFVRIVSMIFFNEFFGMHEVESAVAVHWYSLLVPS